MPASSADGGPGASAARGPTEQSFGGLTVRRRGGSDLYEVLVIRPRGTRVTGLPKGGANDGETPEQTAIREIREETGTTVRIREFLGDVNYWYRRKGRHIHKTVTFFLCDYISGSTDDHDHEVDEARWIPLESAPLRLTYSAERELARLALSRLTADR